MDTLKRRHPGMPDYQGSLEPEYSDDKLYKPTRQQSGNKWLGLPKEYRDEALAILKEYHDDIIPIALTLISFWTRFYLISYANFVVWDEAHFGKFGSYYIKREFYFDVHPPLGKMLVGLAGILAGYDGRFSFNSGEAYPDSVNYGFMRLFCASFGAWMVPLTYYTAKELAFSMQATVLVTLMVLLDTAYLCISRFILLDSMLLFFTLTSVFCLTKFHNQRNESFSLDWWLWLTLTGISIGCVSSVKWVGLLVTALVGLYTIEDLWDKFGDFHMPKPVYLKHWIARIVCLIVLPVAVYMLCFVIHFAILNHSGPGDAQMSSLFQAGLEGNDFHSNPLEVAYGSKVTIKNMGYGGGLLHSHVQTYPQGIGSSQQQVTCYHHKDSNNEWLVKKPRESPMSESEIEVDFVNNGDAIRLLHGPTGANLHSHPIKAPVTKSQWEVSCYGNDTVGDHHDYWIVEIVDDLNEKHVERIRSLTTRFRLRHKVLGCYLRAANTVLPQWGFKQIEVTCDKRNNIEDPHTHWNIERHWNDKLPAAPAANYRSKFLYDFWHLNVAMYTSNNALIPDRDKEDILASTPDQWPLLTVGLRMCGWADDAIKFYLLGNPIVWWSGTASLALYAVMLLFYMANGITFFMLAR
ncbi:10528_t:CDS:10 [Paraglomus occultum]|uniref:Dolichyl-phosphate-mannose--protein mannosyltransferase n=1 Tax=Paraglomus occultum TaxID=144539 RepID=A0A9N8ZFZ6_9GLOM|nr:10528_t:CDS:10 [Paraglomus occultum]